MFMPSVNVQKLTISLFFIYVKKLPVTSLIYRILLCAVLNWSISEVLLWLESHNFHEHRQRFVRLQITGKELIALNASKLKVSRCATSKSIIILSSRQM